MYRYKTCGMAAVLLFCAAALELVACHSDSVSGRSARAAVACRKACDLGQRAPAELMGPGCLETCIARVVGSNAKCAGRRMDWLECWVTASRDEQAAPWWGATAAERCGLQRNGLDDCEAPCSLAGTLRSGRTLLEPRNPRTLGWFELTHCGCTPCVLHPGASPGMLCEAPKVCAEHRVACGDGSVWYALRLCALGHCADTRELRAVLPQIDGMGGCDLPP